MVTTIQINKRTLEILKKIKEDTNSSSYDETINKVVARLKRASLAVYLGKRPIKEILRDLREKNERL